MDYKEKSMIIDKYIIGDNQKRFVIAEIGMNHNGVYDNAIKLIDIAIEAGADCVKFQIRCLDELYSQDALKVSKGDLSTQYTLGLLKKFELTFDEYRKISLYCKDRNILFLCTPWDIKSVDLLEKLDVPAYKIASADMTNYALIDYLCEKNKPLILSTGMSKQEEIDDVVRYINNKKNKINFALLHCNSTYPAPFKDINLSYIKKLMKYNVPIGYSGHERGTAVTLAAVALGAVIIERHITLNRDMEGPDHSASLEKKDFKYLIKGIRHIEKAMGSDKDRVITQGELINRENLSKSIYANVHIDKNEIFKKNMFIFRSPGQGLQPNKLRNILGKKAIKCIKKGDPIFKSDYESVIKAKKNYKFKRKWAIPVRYHDINNLLNVTNPDLIEFHMSFNDLDESPGDFLADKYDCGFLVHAPELFENDHLLDLCTPNNDYRNKSITHMQKLIDVTKSLKKYFPTTSKPKIIVNCGGFSKDNFIPDELKVKYYQNLMNSFDILDANDVEILPQTMAPYPWHFGGQRYQNLFMNVSEIIDFNKKTGVRVCHDISHSFLACNKYNWNHVNYTESIAPFTAHYHISDGSGVDGEGLQIGEGDINFNELLPIINKYSQDISFIPEVWQGHTNNGEGFWISLEKLEGKL